jgi:hypothetical protein
MNIVLLNWKDGENDPFSYINSELKLRFEDHSCNVDIVSTEGELAQNIFLLDYQKGIDAVIAHQGIGSNIRLASNGKLIWDDLKVCLICLHSDHPSQAPQNHTADSKYIFHTYCNKGHELYSNNMITRINPATHLPLPSFYHKRNNKTPRKGEYFVFPKNIDPIYLIFENWKKTLPDIFYISLRNASEAIIDNYKLGNPVNHQDLIVKSIKICDIELISKTSVNLNESKIWHYIFQQTDKIYRNAASQLVVEELADFPLLINGRGWDYFSQNASKHHRFSNINLVKDADTQFNTLYGIIDVVPHKNSLHDRTLRAIAHSSGFLSNSQIDFNIELGKSFPDIFYSGIRDNLRLKAENVINDPEYHINNCQEFGALHDSRYSFTNFIDKIKYFKDLSI